MIGGKGWDIAWRQLLFLGKINKYNVILNKYDDIFSFTNEFYFMGYIFYGSRVIHAVALTSKYTLEWFAIGFHVNSIPD